MLYIIILLTETLNEQSDHLFCFCNHAFIGYERNKTIRMRSMLFVYTLSGISTNQHKMTGSPNNHIQGSLFNIKNQREDELAI